MRDIIISNGFNKFGLSSAAAELNKLGRLNLLITGAYPCSKVLNFIYKFRLDKSKKIKKLIQRKENIDDNLIKSYLFSEQIYNFTKNNKLLSLVGFKHYVRCASNNLQQAFENGAKIYHYRAGFGHQSVLEAKKLGMITVCDFSIVHPRFIVEKDKPLGFFWEFILSDLKLADYILCNSNYVKDSLIDQGWPQQIIKVIYWGVDDGFLKLIPQERQIIKKGKKRFLFAGDFGHRKGADILLSALETLKFENWELSIAGTINEDSLIEFEKIISKPNVNYLGILGRDELAKTMSKYELFIFPSRAEGSARVVFESLACGLPVITTEETGSIVQNEINGWIVPSNDPNSLSSKINEVILSNIDLKVMGENSKKLIFDNFTQHHYGQKLTKFYDSILDSKQL